MEQRTYGILASIKNGNDVSVSQQIILVINLSIPAILSQIAMVVMEYIDASMVGRLGANQSASIGLVASSTWLLGSICMAVTTGFSVQVAQKIGAKKDEEARNVLRNGIVVTLLVAILLSLAGALISGYLPSILGGDASIRKESSSYFLIYACSLPAVGMNSLAGGVLQSSGNMRIPSILNILMCLLDVVFNIIFIFSGFTVSILHHAIRIKGFGLGVSGAAIGTALAELVTGIIMLYFLFCKSAIFKSRKTKNQELAITYINTAYTKASMKISLPIVFENIVVCGAMIASIRIVAPLGVIALSAHSFAITVESLCYMPGYGIAGAATTLIGQCVGAKRPELTKRFAKVTLLLGMGVMTFTGIVMYMMAPTMMSLLTANAQVQQLGTEVLRIEAFAEPLYVADQNSTFLCSGIADRITGCLDCNVFGAMCQRICSHDTLASRQVD